MKEDLTFNYVNSCFVIKDNLLYWRDSRPRSHFTSTKVWNIWKTKCSGKEAGGFTRSRENATAYRYVSLGGVKYAAHRVVWLLSYGEWPKGVVDHIDGNGLNNSLENLQDTDQVYNSRNSQMNSLNKSGVCGVHWDSNRGKWSAMGYLTVDGKKKGVYLGRFINLEDAKLAREKWQDEQGGFTERHGK